MRWQVPCQVTESGEIGIYRLMHSLRDQPTVGCLAQRGLVAWIGHETHLDQHAGDIGSLQHQCGI